MGREQLCHRGKEEPSLINLRTLRERVYLYSPLTHCDTYNYLLTLHRSTKPTLYPSRTIPTAPTTYPGAANRSW